VEKDSIMKLQRKLTRHYQRLAHFFMGTRAGRILVFVSLPSILLIIALWKPHYAPPIFDAQVHYNEASWFRVSVEAVLNTAEELNVPWLLVGSTPNEGTWKLYERAPQQVIPMLVPGFSRADRDNWFNNEKISAYIENELKHRPYRGIGEFFLFDGQVDTPVVRHMVELAVARDLVLHARSDPNALHQLFALNYSLRIIWAHAGMFTQPDTIADLLERYPGLWVDISLRGDVAPDGELDPRWRELFLRYPERFLVGSGTYTNEYWYQFRYNLNRYRRWLKTLPPEIAERIAYRNGVQLFGLQKTIF
jgi:hypothetical protein